MKQFCIHGHDTFICGRTKDGHCRACKKVLRKSQYQKHKDKEKTNILNWQKTHQDQIRKVKFAYDQKHPEKIRLYNLRHVKGIPDGLYEYLFIKQEGKCAICGTSEPSKYTTKHKYFCFDHDHSCCSKPKTCGKCIRGLLCHPCNRGLGQFRDNLDILTKAIEYLSNYSKRKISNE